MYSTNLDLFQLIAFALMSVACWLGVEKGIFYPEVQPFPPLPMHLVLPHIGGYGNLQCSIYLCLNYVISSIVILFGTQPSHEE